MSFPGWGPVYPRTRARSRVLLVGDALARHAVAQALGAEGHNGVASVVKILDAVEPLVTVEHATSVSAVLSKIQAGEDPTFAELQAVYGSDAALSAQEADALPAQTG